MKTKALLTYLFLFNCMIGIAQNTLVSSGAFFEGEPYLAVHPQNSQHLVAAWMGFQPNQKIVIKSAVSTDGGSTWSTPIWLAHQQASNSSADVSLGFDGSGNLYMAYIDYDNINFTNGAILCRSLMGSSSSCIVNYILPKPVVYRSAMDCSRSTYRYSCHYQYEC